MKRSPEKKWLLLGFGVASLILGWVSFMAHQNATQLLENTNKSKQTYEIIKNLINIYATMTVAESGRRGYVFLNDEKELYRYQAAIRELDPEVQMLRQSLTGKPEQLQRLVTLETLLNHRINLLRQSIQLYQAEKTVTPLQRQITEQSVKLRDEIQLVIASMQSTEELALEARFNQSRSSIANEVLISFLVVSFSLGVLAIASGLLYQQLLLRQAAEALQYKLEKEKELSEVKLKFFSMVSHEFRTPLSVILGSVQLLNEGRHFWTEERRQKNLDRIQSSAKVMTQLLNDILTLTRAEIGNLECSLERVDVEAFCLNLVESIQTPSIKCPIQFVSPTQFDPVELDPTLLRSILTNLLENAIKYSEPHQPIVLSTGLADQDVVFQVQDQGMGIAPEDHLKIYDLFYRGQNVGGTSGTGLGLAVVKQCVELHRGKIFMTSTVGQGTTFTVEIPLTVSDRRS